MARGPVRWAVIGVGIAGRARARAIEADPRSTLVATHKGRFADTFSAPQRSLDEAIQAADAVAICSPNPHHAEQIHQALSADRHVLVEFPLAPDPRQADALFALAAARQRVLHVEHIELLDPAQRTLRAHAHPELIRSLDITFERRGPAEISLPEAAILQVARLHRLAHLGGEFLQIDEITEVPGGFRSAVQLRGAGHGAPPLPATLSFTQGPDRERKTVFTVDGTVNRWVMEGRVLLRNDQPQTLLSSRPLFEQDHRHAMARILDGHPPYVSDRQVLHILQVAEALGQGRTGPLPTAQDPASIRAPRKETDDL